MTADTSTSQHTNKSPFRSLFNGPDIWANFYRSSENYTICFEGLADFNISLDGKSVECFPRPTLSDAVRAHLLEQHVSPLMLSLQGEVIFHASCIKHKDQAIAFLGESGAGKSTLAAFFTQNGHPFLADDKLLIENMGESILCHPSGPRLNIWDETREALFNNSGIAISFDPITSKHFAKESNDFPHHKTPLNLRAIFFMKNNNANCIEIEPLTGNEKFLALFYNSFQMDPQNKRSMTQIFKSLSELAPHIQTYTLDYPRRFNCLNAVKAQILSLVDEGNYFHA